MIYFSFVRAILRQCVKLFCVVRLFFKPLCRCAIVVDLFLSLFVRRCSTIRCCFVSLCRPAARRNVCAVRLVFLFLSSCECCVPRAHERGSFCSSCNCPTCFFVRFCCFRCADAQRRQYNHALFARSIGMHTNR